MSKNSSQWLGLVGFLLGYFATVWDCTIDQPIQAAPTSNRIYTPGKGKKAATAPTHKTTTAGMGKFRALKEAIPTRSQPSAKVAKAAMTAARCSH
jgi:hypothetical protein